MGLARRQEEKLQRLRQWTRPSAVRPGTTPDSSSRQATVGPPGSSVGSTNTSKEVQRVVATLPRKISSTEMQAHRKKGLCYYCDERFVPGHRCKKLQIFLLEESNDTKDEDVSIPSKVDEHNSSMEVSFNALIGLAKAQTMRLNGLIKQTTVSILVQHT